MLERLLSKKVELWVVAIIVILGMLVMLLFGMVVYDLSRGKDRLGPLSGPVRTVVSSHTVLSQLVREMRHPTRALRARGDALPGQSGFDFTYDPGSRPDAPYLLLNRYDADLRRSVSELVDLNSQDMVNEWVYDVDPIWKDSSFESNLIDLRADMRSNRFRGTHALIPPSGDRIVLQGMHSPMLEFDLCGELVWEEPSYVYHHSIEMDADGNYWVPGQIEPPTVDIGGAEFMDDGIIQISPDGEVLSEKSVIAILDENDLGYLIYGHGFEQADPIHLNDIQPVLEDGAIWRRGDLFLSIRNRSLVLLYRPSTGRVLWHHAGTWTHQHDVDILDDRRISVFDNNARLVGQCPDHQTTDPCMEGNVTNRLIVMDVTTDEWVSAYAEGFEGLDIGTNKQGRGTILPSGNLFVEETNQGRALEMTPSGEALWSYMNRAEFDGKPYTLNWSRIIPRETGDALREKLAGGICTP